MQAQNSLRHGIWCTLTAFVRTTDYVRTVVETVREIVRTLMILRMNEKTLLLLE
jgi:hypothetical protein